MKSDSFRKELWTIAVPVALQSLLTSSFAMIDQLMIGQLGQSAIAGVGAAARYINIFSIAAAAVASAAGIFAAQYISQNNTRSLWRTFTFSVVLSALLGVLFWAGGLFAGDWIASVYGQDLQMQACAASYLRIFVWSFGFQIVINLVSVILRCIGMANRCLLSSVIGAMMNTGLNWILIFGNLGAPRMAEQGAALASLISVSVSAVMLLYFFWKGCRSNNLHFALQLGGQEKGLAGTYIRTLIPLFVCEVMWVLGENVYAICYGALGTDAFSAVTMINTIMGLTMGLLSGLSVAAGIMTGQKLGQHDDSGAMQTGHRLIRMGWIFSGALAVICCLAAPLYVSLYAVDAAVRHTAMFIMFAFALYMPIKTENMIIGGGILRSGGKTQLTMYLDLFGTWCIGVPLALLGTFVFHWNIVAVYMLLSLEEVVRLILCFWIFRRQSWLATF